MTPTAFCRTALIAVALLAAAAAPAMAEHWHEPGTAPCYAPSHVQPYAPVGVAPTGPAWQDRHVGPAIVLPCHIWPRNLTPLRNDRYLPLACLERFRVGTGTLDLFEDGCLERQGVRVRDLPDRCGVTLRTGHDVLRGYDPACLRDAGYRMAGD
jgi:hypothetical protein